MTDNEIIKALECCILYKQICSENCPLCDVKSCKENLRKHCLDLINRQKAEIERLNEKAEALGDPLEKAHYEISKFNRRTYRIIRRA